MVLGRVASRAAAPAFAAPAAGLLRRRARGAADLEALIDVAFDFDCLGVQIRPGQVRAEIRALLIEVQRMRPHRILEIGTQHGGTLFMFAQVAAEDARLISVDLPHGEFGGGYPAWRGRLYRRFGRPGQTIELIRGDSHADTTIDEVKDLLAGSLLDFMLIDGDHSYEGVRADFERYSPLVRPGGLIAIHDVAPPRPGAGPRAEESNLLGGEVPRFWGEIRDRYRTASFEFSELGYFGVGIVRV